MIKKIMLGVLGLSLCASVAFTQNSTLDLSVVYNFLNGLVVDDITISGVELSTGSSQNSALTVPANSIGGGEVSGMMFNLVFCGQADENGTIYYSPAAGVNMVDYADGVDYSIASAACDGLDGATEATQDLILFPHHAVKVMGMYCMTNGTHAAAETAAFTFHSGAAVVTPSLTCTVSEAEKSCATLSGTTTNVAANTTMSVQAVMVSDNADDDHWCMANVMLQ